MNRKNISPSLELLSRCKVSEGDGYICGRSWPSTATPELYDVRMLDGTILKGLPRERLSDIVPPTEEMRQAVVR